MIARIIKGLGATVIIIILTAALFTIGIIDIIITNIFKKSN